jgi:chromosome segregation ATPase
MVDYLRIPCPNCKHLLRVRKQYIGIEVTCTRCSHDFVVQDPGDSASTSDSEAAAAESREAELKGNLELVRNDFARVVAENARAADQLQQLNERYAEREARLFDLERSLNASQEAMRQSVEYQRELEHVKAAATEGREAYEKQIEDLKSELDRARADFARAAADSTQAAEQLQDLTERYTKHEAHLLELQQSLSESQQENRRSSQSRQELEHLISAAHEGREAYENQITNLKSELDRVREEFTRAVSESNQAAGQLKQLTEQCAERDNNLAELQRALSDSQAEVRQYGQTQVELDGLKTESAEVRKDYEAHIIDLQSEVKEVRDQLASATSENAQAIEQLGLLGDRCAEREARLVEVERSLQASREEARQSEQYRREIERLNSELARAAQNSNLASELERLQRELDQAQRRANELDAELASLRATTRTETFESSGVQRQINELGLQLQEARDENERLRTAIGQLGISVG